MKNLKALALTATLAVGTIFGTVAPANAGTCWFVDKGAEKTDGFNCKTEVTMDKDGQPTWFVYNPDGDKKAIRFYDDAVVRMYDGAEIGAGFETTYLMDAEGTRWIDMGQGYFGIKF